MNGVSNLFSFNMNLIKISQVKKKECNGMKEKEPKSAI